MTQLRFPAGALLALTLTLGSSSASAIDLFTQPTEPVDTYPTRLVLRGFNHEFYASSTPLVERDGDTIKVFLSEGNCPFLCPPNVAVIGVELGVLPAGNYDVELWLVSPEFGSSSLRYSLGPVATRSLTVTAGPAITSVPAEPSSDEEVELRLTNVVGRCPRVLPVQREGQQIEITIDLYGCSGPEQAYDFTVPLGNLPAGDYAVTLTSLGQYLAQAELSVAAADTLLQQGRFQVEVSWENSAGVSGPGRLVQPPSQDSALFYFFSEDNWELMVKVLDGCAINGFYWVFGAASTDVAYQVKISEVGGTRTFEFGNEAGQPAAATTSITAFACE